MRGRSAAASSECAKSVGRMPTITDRSWPRSGESVGKGIPRPGNTTLSPATAASTKFMLGEPMKAPTNRFTGLRNNRWGVSHCCNTPSRSTATR